MSDTRSMPNRRQWLQTAGLTGAAPLLSCVPAAASTPAATAVSGPKVLRYAFKTAETGFDPAKVQDLYSRIVTGHLFEGLYAYDHLARPPKIKPLTAAALPEVSPDFRVFVIRVQPGIFFMSDPAFKGQRRELVAEDYVYAIKRFADPANKSPAWGDLEEANFLGLAALREECLQKRQPFDYDRVVPGLRALDRHTLRLEVAAARPRLIELLTGSDLFGAVAREVVEFYGPEEIMGHPVGTGPFKLVQWRRSSLIALERNPEYRERTYDAEPAPDDTEGQALLARFKGRRLPMVDRVEVSIIEESQPRWLSFLNGQQNFIERVPEEFATLAMPNGRVAPNLAHQHIQGYRSLAPDIGVTLYNMEDPVVGGYTPAKIALRRAMNLAMDIPREISLVRQGQGVPAQSLVVPNTSGYDPNFRSEMGQYDPARAKALLDIYGYVDRDGDGWREQPDGSPLLIRRASQPDQFYRSLDELWQRNMQAIGIRGVIEPAKWPENLKAAQAGSLMSWFVNSSASQFDGQSGLGMMFGPKIGGDNMARFKSTEFDALYLKMQAMPDGPERWELFRQAQRIGIVYAPYKCHVHRYVTDMASTEVHGYRRPPFWNEWWQYVDIAPESPRT